LDILSLELHKQPDSNAIPTKDQSAKAESIASHAVLKLRLADTTSRGAANQFDRSASVRSARLLSHPGDGDGQGCVRIKFYNILVTTDPFQPVSDLEVYFDDSGTDANTPVAVAACYIASKEQWNDFARNWDEVAKAEGFEAFHMSEFVAKKEAGRKPFCDWDNRKKGSVYDKLASIINTRIRRGFAVAVPKAQFDRYVFQEFKDGYAADHYTFAIRTILSSISDWRQQYEIRGPMQYVFDRGSLNEKRIEQIWKEDSRNSAALVERRFGMVPEGIMFQDDAFFKPLQAADILGWQVQNHMRRTILIGLPTSTRGHHGHEALWKNRSLTVSYYGTEQLEESFSGAKAYRDKEGKWPWEDNLFRERTIRREGGSVY
jgi:hypothetical protein